MRQGVALSPGGSDGHDARSGSAPMTALSPEQEELCRQDRWDFSGLRAMFVNCTLKRSPEQSHTQGLADISMEIMRRQGVSVELRSEERRVGKACVRTGRSGGSRYH